MKTDEIVNRLRECARHCDGVHACWNDTTLEAAAALIESMQAQLVDYHHMSRLVDGKMSENQRLRRINEKLQAQLEEKEKERQAWQDDFNRLNESGLERIAELEAQLTDEKITSQSLRNAANGYKAQLAASQRRERAANAQWIETASDNTNYVLAYADGFYCVTDAFGAVVCEFMRSPQEAGEGDSDKPKEDEPLTLDELRQMDGEPVYVVTLDNPLENQPYWAIAGINSNDSRYQNGVALYNRVQGDWGAFDLYGDTWLAYRRKPAETEG